MEIDDRTYDHLDALNVTEVLDKSSNNIQVINNSAAQNAAKTVASNPSDSNPTPAVSNSGETNHSDAPNVTRNFRIQKP